MACPCHIFSRTRSDVSATLHRVHRASAVMQGECTPPAEPIRDLRGRLMCPLSMGCEQAVCAARSPTLESKLAGVRMQFPTGHILLNRQCGQGWLLPLSLCRALSSSDCASSSWVLMGKLLLVQISRGKYSRLLFLDVGLRLLRWTPAIDRQPRPQSYSSHGRLFWL